MLKFFLKNKLFPFYCYQKKSESNREKYLGKEQVNL